LQRIDQMLGHIQSPRRDRYREQLFDASFQPILAHGVLHGTGYTRSNDTSLPRWKLKGQIAA